MRNWFPRFLALLILLSLCLPPIPASAAVVPSASTQPRLVVFEEFSTPTCGHCQLAAPAVADLSAAYAAAGQPVLFLEYEVSDPAFNGVNNRTSRFWATQPTGTILTPLVIVDSGQQSLYGHSGDTTASFKTNFKAMVDAALLRAPKAEVYASYARLANHVHFSVQVTNNSGVALSAANNATVTAIVYEQFAAPQPGISLTTRFVRAAQPLAITGQANGATATYSLDTVDLPAGVVWNNLRALVIVDYRPGGATGRYDTLQAAIATHQYLVAPASLNFMVDIVHPQNQTERVNLVSSAAGFAWTAAKDVPWLSVSPLSGTSSIPAVITVTGAALQPGNQTGKVTFTLTSTDGLNTTKEVPVSAFLGHLYYMPFVGR